MTRSVVIRVRLSCDRRGSMISELSDDYLRWGLGPTLLLSGEEMQTGLSLGGSLSRCVLGECVCASGAGRLYDGPHYARAPFYSYYTPGRGSRSV